MIYLTKYIKKKLIKRKKDGCIYTKIDRMKKIPIFTFLQALGFTKKKILHSIKNTEFLSNMRQKSPTKSTEKSLIKINEIITEKNSNKNIVCKKF